MKLSKYTSFLLGSILCLLFCSFASDSDQSFALNGENSIPVVDMQDFYRPQTRQAFVNEISKALQEVGFFAVINTGVNEEVIDQAYHATSEFFKLPVDEKLKSDSTSTNRQRGYIPFYTEIAKNKGVGDFKEFYHIGPSLDDKKQLELAYYPNVWPEQVNFKEPMLAFYQELSMYMKPLQQAMAMAIGEHEDFLHDMTKDGDNLLRIIHYPAKFKNNQQEAVWAEAHTDIDLFTILPRATADGLEVLGKDGKWIRVKVPKGAFIINGGDMLENLSNGFFKSSVHRVMAPESDPFQERFSMVFFIHPRSEDNLEPRPNSIALTGGLQNYARATRWELLMERLADLNAATPSLLEDLAKSGVMERQIQFNRASVDAMKRLKDHQLASPKVLEELSRLEKVNTI